MKCEEYICDICGRHTKPRNSVRAKIKNMKYFWMRTGYGMKSELLPNSETWNLCVDCIMEIKERVCK